MGKLIMILILIAVSLAVGYTYGSLNQLKIIGGAIERGDIIVKPNALGPNTPKASAKKK